MVLNSTSVALEGKDAESCSQKKTQILSKLHDMERGNGSGYKTHS